MNNRLREPERASRLVRQLWRLMQGRGWSVAQLAEAAGVSQETLEAWRAGRRQPGVEALGRCFGALDCELVPMPRCRRVVPAELRVAS
jgi:transcriptional regulator with XRE-family HTH domain